MCGSGCNIISNIIYCSNKFLQKCYKLISVWCKAMLWFSFNIRLHDLEYSVCFRPGSLKFEGDLSVEL